MGYFKYEELMISVFTLQGSHRNVSHLFQIMAHIRCSFLS